MTINTVIFVLLCTSLYQAHIIIQCGHLVTCLWVKPKFDIILIFTVVLRAFNLLAKFEVCSFSHSKDIEEVPQLYKYVT